MIGRREAIERIERERFDVLVIGGGITGAGVALDAAARGYSVAIVERDDWACGTSSRSSKMVHGGLRYLKNFDIGLVREALVERELLVNRAPHLVWPVPFVIPAFGGARKDFFMGVGLRMYDVMAASRYGGQRGDDDEWWHPSRHRSIEGDEVKRLLPALAHRDPNAGYLFYDCQTDDSRLVLSVLGEAERYGAVLLNGARAVRFVDEGGRAVGAVCREEESGGEIEVRARHLVSATGVWADRIRPGELEADAEAPHIRPSRGTHVTFAHDRLPLEAAAIVPAGGGRMLFALPWMGATLVGTTDVDYEGELEHIRPSGDDVDYILKALNRFFDRELTHDDVSGAFAGIRPLVSHGDSKRSVDISRREELYETSSGMITITGGKLTTYRHMAEVTVDRVAASEGSQMMAPCSTREIPIGLPIDPDELPREGGVDGDERRHLAARYGHAAMDVLELAAERPSLLERIVPGHPDILAEAAFAARREQARRVSDVLLRRTRLGLTAGRALASQSAQAPRRVAEAMAPERGWGEGEIDAAVDEWRAAAAAEGVAATAESLD